MGGKVDQSGRDGNWMGARTVGAQRGLHRVFLKGGGVRGGGGGSEGACGGSPPVSYPPTTVGYPPAAVSYPPTGGPLQIVFDLLT